MSNEKAHPMTDAEFTSYLRESLIGMNAAEDRLAAEQHAADARDAARYRWLRSYESDGEEWLWCNRLFYTEN